MTNQKGVNPFIKIALLLVGAMLVVSANPNIMANTENTI